MTSEFFDDKPPQPRLSGMTRARGKRGQSGLATLVGKPAEGERKQPSPETTAAATATAAPAPAPAATPAPAPAPEPTPAPAVAAAYQGSLVSRERWRELALEVL
ncbi:hypothetical protein ABZW49_40320, partial [Nonomuraea wenchangensis]